MEGWKKFGWKIKERENVIYPVKYTAN